jgi:CubicO group peptidase (beta-lactamase class C family)
MADGTGDGRRAGPRGACVQTGLGEADLGRHVAATPDHLYRAGSITKVTGVSFALFEFRRER